MLAPIALLLAGAAAAPAHSATKEKSPTAIKPVGEVSLMSPMSNLTPEDYKEYGDSPGECYFIWEMFDKARCWCHTGCALDCTQGGTPGIPGNEIHPAWCSPGEAESEAECAPIVCELLEQCKDVPTSLAPGLSAIECAISPKVTTGAATYSGHP